VGFLCGLSVFPGLLVILICLFLFNTDDEWQSYQSVIPETKSALIFNWKAIHPFISEYDRTIQVVSDGRKSKEYWLSTNTGGKHHLNLYLLTIENENWLRILDKFSKCVINLNTHEGLSIGRKSGKTFVAPPNKMEYWGYTGNHNNPENLQAFLGEIKGTYDPRFDKPGKYIGALDARTEKLRFIPAA
jgi:hypothetical protein